MAIGIRKNMANVAGRHFGRCILEPIGRTSVARAEVATGNAVAAHAVYFAERVQVECLSCFMCLVDL